MLPQIFVVETLVLRFKAPALGTLDRDAHDPIHTQSTRYFGGWIREGEGVRLQDFVPTGGRLKAFGCEAPEMSSKASLKNI